MSKVLSISILLSIFFGFQISGQQLSIEQAVLQNGLFPSRPTFSWGGPSGGYLQVKNGSIVSIQAKSSKESVILTKEELNSVLQSAGVPSIPFISMPEVLPSGFFRFTTRTHILDFDWNQKRLVSIIQVPVGAENLALSPSGNAAAYTVGNNISIIDNQGKKADVTSDLQSWIVNGQSVSRSEFGISSGLFWSPKGSLLAFYRKDEQKVTEYPLVNLATTPALPDLIRYPMAGGPSETISVGIFNPNTGRTVFLDEKAFGDDRYLTNISWDPSENFVYAAVVNREQNHMLLNQYDATTGKMIKTLFEEKSEKYVEPLRGLIFNPSNPQQFIWISERDGFDHLYLYSTDGVLIKQLTRGDWVITDFLGWDNRGRNVFFRATDPSPLERHIYRVDVASGARIRLTADPGTHDGLFSPDWKYMIDSYSSLTVPRRIYLRDLGTKESKTIFDAPNPALSLKMGTYRSIRIKSADKRTDLYGYLVLPADMDSTKKYPVIVYVYGGPHAQLVLNTWMGGASGWQHYMAQQGFISMTIDNRGSDARGRDFEQVIHRNLGKAEMADQMEGIHYLLSLPYIDHNRIGVHGWSYGGFMTTSLMLNYPDIYKVGAAGGPVIDWKFYEVMYGERYMDMPSENPDGYELSSTLNKVKNLRGRLMLIHGDSDPTVVWQNSLAFVKKCVDDGILVDYMVYPGHPHNVRGKDRVHLMRTVTRYFQDNL
jgi:dipeptidyl-peptidase 4